MSETIHPRPCPHCGDSLQEPTPFCPYCGKMLAVDASAQERQNSSPVIPSSSGRPADSPNRETAITNTIVSKPSIENQDALQPVPPFLTMEVPSESPTLMGTPKVTPQETAAVHTPQPPPPLTDPMSISTEPRPAPERKTGAGGSRIAMVLLVIVIAAMGAFFLFQKDDLSSTPQTASSPSPFTNPPQHPEQGCVQEMDWVQGAFRRGIDLSRNIQKVEQLKVVLQNAKKLLQFSDRYKVQVESAQKALNEVTAARDWALTDYQNKLLTLGQGEQQKVTCGLKSFQESTRDQEEKQVATLLIRHLKQFQKGQKPEGGQLLSDYSPDSSGNKK